MTTESKSELKKKKLSESIETETVFTVGDTEKRTRNKGYIADLRIHTPQALGIMNVEGIDHAPALVRLCKAKEIDLIGVTDYYTFSFAERVLAAVGAAQLKVLPGIMVRIRVGVCDDVTMNLVFPAEHTPFVREGILQNLEILPSWAMQSDFVLPYSLETLIDRVQKLGGIIIPSRMDKTPQRMQILPELVERFGFRAFDLAYQDTVPLFKEKWRGTKFQLMSFSNARALAQVGSRTVRIKVPNLDFVNLQNLFKLAPTTTTDPRPEAAHSR